MPVPAPPQQGLGSRGGSSRGSSGSSFRVLLAVTLPVYMLLQLLLLLLETIVVGKEDYPSAAKTVAMLAALLPPIARHEETEIVLPPR